MPCPLYWNVGISWILLVELPETGVNQWQSIGETGALVQSSIGRLLSDVRVNRLPWQNHFVCNQSKTMLCSDELGATPMCINRIMQKTAEKISIKNLWKDGTWIQDFFRFIDSTVNNAWVFMKKNQIELGDWYLWVCIIWRSKFKGTFGPWWRYAL